MARLLALLAIVVVIQLLLVWTFTHLGVIAVGACAWGAWRWWKGRRHA